MLKGLKKGYGKQKVQQFDGEITVKYKFAPMFLSTKISTHANVGPRSRVCAY